MNVTVLMLNVMEIVSIYQALLNAFAEVDFQWVLIIFVEKILALLQTGLSGIPVQIAKELIF